MTAKEKAEDLVFKCVKDVLFTDLMSISEAKVCALIVVDEIIKSNPHNTPIIYGVPAHSTMEYWQEVRQEIENL